MVVLKRRKPTARVCAPPGQIRVRTEYARAMEEERQIIHPAPFSARASIWKNFGFYQLQGKKELDKTYAVCKLFRAKVKYFANTTNLRTHIERHHPEVKDEEPKAANVPVGQCTLHHFSKMPVSSEQAKKNNSRHSLFHFVKLLL